jgi:hypothetical protein
MSMSRHMASAVRFSSVAQVYRSEFGSPGSATAKRTPTNAVELLRRHLAAAASGGVLCVSIEAGLVPGKRCGNALTEP